MPVGSAISNVIFATLYITMPLLHTMLSDSEASDASIKLTLLIAIFCPESATMHHTFSAALSERTIHSNNKVNNFLIIIVFK